MLAKIDFSFRRGRPCCWRVTSSRRTQRGNNNAYCQDNEISWVDWSHDECGEALTRFIRRLTSLRRQYAVLRQNRFLTAQWNEELGVKDFDLADPCGRGDDTEPLAGSRSKMLGSAVGRSRSDEWHPAAR